LSSIGLAGITNFFILGKPASLFSLGRADRGFLCAQFMPVVRPALNVDGELLTDYLLEELRASLLTEDLPSVRLATISTMYLAKRKFSPGAKSGVCFKKRCSNCWQRVVLV